MCCGPLTSDRLLLRYDSPCASWLAKDANGYFGPWNRHTANPILVVNNTSDPETPYQDGIKMTRQLAQARLLTVAGYGHTTLLNPGSCVKGYESAYFRTGALPPLGVLCRPDRQPFTSGPSGSG